MTKSRMPNLEAAVKDSYNKTVTIYKQLIVHGGRIDRAICWISTPVKEVTINECMKEDDTDCVHVTDGSDLKTFYQGVYLAGKPGTEEDYHGVNAYVAAEQYAIGLL